MNFSRKCRGNHRKNLDFFLQIEKRGVYTIFLAELQHVKVTHAFLLTISYRQYPMRTMGRLLIRFSNVHIFIRTGRGSKKTFTNESRLCPFSSNKRIPVWRGYGHRFERNCVEPVRAFGNNFIMVWGEISTCTLARTSSNYHLQECQRYVT